ncbi:hypothetical protein [Leptospira borgpetersenii]|uniref:Uncharacterized protein n=1 Tax=Leptospira borgpetersenii serovar Ballum TaxID=280505 RepID=A0A0E3B3P1_LEPBO|nr:hypothetical protein [Leptospira borgpetersenii]EMO09093.1 hypothetical protein LEP1GSC137_2594 [Leptospira borgpetersenii str. Noumea 25]ALO27451.1 hypothetical protein LBBP_03251 [Leptospira borgpetersenii serovar Ballum]ANH01782.1 Uncharacterized protein LB4E_2551 [Leptospira borgpetersenii str. 4E]EKQ99472.1 hypothetical protein LEP1GSC121_2052 [Leptospira borgpetersenii serovar Castellonis str. 200801910]KGE25595.1 hypothetical protein IQ66_04370 [Leptospira borgpetersenii serovar Ball
MSVNSRTDAHKTFADLYRKQRSPEHQEQIDEVIQKSNDIFIRIDLMRKIDEEFEKKRQEENKKSEEDRPKRNSEKSAAPTKTIPKPTRRTESNSSGGGGFLANLFGGNPAINKFAKESGTIDIGFLGRKLQVSGGVHNLFKFLKEDQIIATIQALRFCEQQGWRYWKPLVYNVVLNFNKLLNSIISLDSLFIDQISPEIFLNRATKLELYYARHLSREDCKDIIMTEVPELVRKDEKLVPKMPQIMAGLSYGVNLESGRPKMSDAIRAFHIVATKRMITWNEIVQQLNVPPINETKFQGSPDIIKEVETTLLRLADDIQTRLNRKHELQSLRERYFRIDDKGRMNFDFLNLIVDDYFENHVPENMQSASMKSSFKGTPHKLMYLLLRDFQASYAPILEGTVKIGSKNQSKDVIIMHPGLFKSDIEQINNLLRLLDAFNKKYPSFQYSFATYNEHTTSTVGVEDQITQNLLKLLGDAAAFMGKFAEKINIIVENHLLAKQYEASGKLNERVLVSKEKVIEEIKILHRFIPYCDSTIVSGNRLSGKTLEFAFLEMTKLFYNYAVIYKDKSTITKLTLHKKLDAELGSLTKEYERLSGKPYETKRMEET